jgi:hypothetical protein
MLIESPISPTSSLQANEPPRENGSADMHGGNLVTPLIAPNPKGNAAQPTEPTIESPDLQASLAAGKQFLLALFTPIDVILFRPVETWTENGKKKSRVLYKSTLHRLGDPTSVDEALRSQLHTSAKERANLFFGVCPRVGFKGKYNLACQIRTVQTLWADIDHSSVDDALAKCAAGKLPEPSIVVNSGNGVHLYWLLDDPYLIDDVGRPRAVETEWIDQPNGRKKPRRYMVEDGERAYLDQRRDLTTLSPKACRIQDILAGIAQVIGGDHTTDLSRLLRIPGTLNRKDERNGREPRPTKLVACEPTRRYSISAFEPLAKPAPESHREKQIVSMPLPTVRKLSACKSDKLNELISACSVAPAGARSELDFRLCCFAIKSGASKAEIWQKVSSVGKFSERGEDYFNRTWENAEHVVRTETFNKVQKHIPATKTEVADDAAPTCDDAPGDDHDGDAGRDSDDNNTTNRPVIEVHPSIPVGTTIDRITHRLLKTTCAYNRAGQFVVLNQATIIPVLSAPELAGLLNQFVEFYFIDDEAGEFKPLPANFANTWLNRLDQICRLPTISLFTHNAVYTTDWRLVVPGYDAASGIYYAGPAVQARDTTAHLDALLADFCFKRPCDRSNFVGMLLTAILMPHFIGSKPAALFNGNQPSIGKSILAQILAIIRDGKPVETATYNPNDEEFEKRIGSIVRHGTTTIIIDNAKSNGRSPCIDSACLERSITDPILSFRLLGASKDIRAENSHLFAITANAPEVSPDLVTRCVVINLFYEGVPSKRTYSISDPEGYAQEYRLDLLGELVGMVERWKAAGSPRAQAHSRFNKRGWGSIVGGILAVAGLRDFLANAEEAAAELDETRGDFTELVAIMIEHPQGIWTGAELAELAKKHQLLESGLGDGSPRSKATRLGRIAGRYVDERFVFGSQVACFRRDDGRKGMIYRVEVLPETPNV